MAGAHFGGLLTPVAAGAPDRPDMVGREVERAELAAALSAAQRGHGRVALLLGEAGMGKSMLADWLAEHARTAGMQVVRGTSSPAGMAPLWPWQRALTAIAPQLPWRGDGGVSFPAASGRDALAAAVVDAIADAAQRRPLLVVLEDLHWSDPASLSVLRAVVDAVPALAVMVLLTCRDDPQEAPPEVHHWLADLPAGARQIPLSAISAEAVSDLARGVVGRTLSERDVRDLHARTGGNPFFVHEVARLLLAHGPAGSLVVPPGVQEVLRRRLARLTQPCALLLSVAAVAAETFGDVIEVDLLPPVSGLDEPTVDLLLAEAVTARLLDDDPGRPQRWRFRHALVREVLARDLPAAERSKVHARVAVALENRAGEPGSAARLAHHWRRATGNGARERAATWSLRAARDAVAGFGFEAAAAHFAHAVTAPPADPIPVLIEYGAALQLAGDAAAARDVLLRAAHAAVAERRPVDLARAALALGGGVAGFEVEVRDDEQTDLLRQADRALPAVEAGLRAAVRARMSLTTAGTVPDADRARLADDAVETARRAGEPEIEAAALAAYCDAIAGPDHVAQRVAAATRMLDLAGAMPPATGPHLTTALLARRLLLVARLEQGDLAAADEQALAYERVAHRTTVPRYRWLPEIWRGMRALLDGDPNRALHHADAAEQIGRSADSGNARLMAFIVRMQAHLDRGTPDQFTDEIDAVLSAIGPSGMPAMYYAAPARALLAAGETGHARAVLRALLAGSPASMPRDAEWLECHWAMADIAVALDDRRAAAALIAALRPYEHLWAVDGLGAAMFGVVAEQLGRLAAQLGRLDDAGRHLRTAREAYQRQGVPALVARIDAVGTTPAPAEPDSGLLRRDGRVWLLEWRGRRSTVPDSKGVRDLAVLLARPGQAVPVLDLAAAAGGPPAAAAGADLGPVLDDTARRAYRHRLAELDGEIDEAESDADLGRLERLRSERSLLTDELTAALGLGGRARIAGDPVERARKAVTMRIRAAINTIGAHDDALARHLRNAVRTGRLCCYEPENPVTWRGI
jgi:tetratricopeptide (TPR) repeat protein